jgi:restriction endonuclease Mrr
MGNRRVDRIEQRLKSLGGRARLSKLLAAVRKEESNPDIPYSSLYIAIQTENERLEESGERTKFVTSREGEDRGWVRLRESNVFPQDSDAAQFESEIHRKNEEIDKVIRSWLERMDWRQFESTFLSRVLESLGFQDVQITQATRDGGADARVSYRRGIVEAKAIISAKRWTSQKVGVEEVRMLRGIKGDEDTAIIVTTGYFTNDAQTEAKPSQNQRIVYLVDGAKLIDICKRNQIGVKRVQLPELLTLDPEVDRPASADVLPGEGEPEEGDSGNDVSRRFRDEMLGDRESGLTAKEIAELTDYSVNTVRNYLSTGRQKTLGDAIRDDDEARTRALAIVSKRRR